MLEAPADRLDDVGLEIGGPDGGLEVRKLTEEIVDTRLDFRPKRRDLVQAIEPVIVSTASLDARNLGRARSKVIDREQRYRAVVELVILPGRSRASLGVTTLAARSNARGPHRIS